MITPGTFEVLTNVEKLNLERNNIEYLSAYTFSGLVKLVTKMVTWCLTMTKVASHIFSMRLKFGIR